MVDNNIFSKEGIKNFKFLEEENIVDKNLYLPSAVQTKDGVYEATIRFIYNPYNPNLSIMKKSVASITDIYETKHYFDSRLTLNDYNCPIFQLKKKLKYSKNPIENQLASKIVIKDVFYALVYIIDDRVNPEYNGTIKVFRFGSKVKNKIERAMKGRNGEIIDIFNFFTGKNFNLYITIQAKFNNYDDSVFDSVSSPIPILKDNKYIPADSNNPEHIAILKNMLENAPKLENYAKFNELTNNDLEKLNQLIFQFESYVKNETGISSIHSALKYDNKILKNDNNINNLSTTDNLEYDENESDIYNFLNSINTNEEPDL